MLQKIRDYISDYMFFEDARVTLVLSLWAMATHMFQTFDAFPYLVITASTKQAGKTRLSELIGFLSRNTKNAATMSASAMFRSIEEFKPTIIWDEAETLSSGAAGDMRSVLNAGYRKGQTVMRTIGLEVTEFAIYCPKVFVLIGDVYDTLRDRSIIITMKRGEQRKRFNYDDVKNEGKHLQAAMLLAMPMAIREKIEAAYDAEVLDFLSDRDAEIWRPLFAICRVLFPEQVRELQRVAVDLATDKTAERKRHVNLSAAEDDTQADHYARKMLRDLFTVINGDKHITTEVAIERLTALDLSPWRRYKGGPMTGKMLADFVARFGVRPRPIRLSGQRDGKGQRARRGYLRAEVEKAMEHLK